jgi:hypothetical protein
MSNPPRIPSNKAASAWVIATVAVCVPAWDPVRAASFASRMADSKVVGINAISPIGEVFESTTGQGFKGGFSYGLGVDSIYDSNFFLTEDNPESELGINFAPWISYGTDPEGGADFSMTANYRPVIQTYMENPDYNGMDHSGDVSMRIKGAKTVISAHVNYDQNSGTDQIIGEFVNESLFSAGIDGSYQIAPRTSLSASLTASMSDYDNDSIEGSEIYTAYIGGYWSATERFSVGPAIRYVTTKSDNTGTRDSWEFLVQTQYRLREKIQLAASLGVEYSTNSRDEGDGSIGMTGSLVGSYAISEKLEWVGSIRYITVPSPSDVDYVINNLMISTALNRQLLRGAVSLGIDLNLANYEQVGSVSTTLEDDNTMGAFLSYNRQLFLERLNFYSKILYVINSGQEDWSQVQVSIGLGIQF